MLSCCYLFTDNSGFSHQQGLQFSICKVFEVDFHQLMLSALMQINHEWQNKSKGCSMSQTDKKRRKITDIVRLLGFCNSLRASGSSFSFFTSTALSSPVAGVLSLPKSETLSQQDVGWDNTESASSSVPVTWEILQLSLHFNATSESELCCNSDEPKGGGGHGH